MSALPNIEIVRYIYNIEGDRNCIGDVYLDGEFFCFSLEDEIRPNGVKVYGDTAIMADEYEWQVTRSNRFKRDMILIKGVPMFSGIRMHGGNTSKDTHGCPLVAFSTNGVKIWGTAEKKLTAWAKSVGGKGIISIVNRPLSYDNKHFKG